MDPAIFSALSGKVVGVAIAVAIGLVILTKGVYDWHFVHTNYGLPPESVLNSYEPSIREGGQQILKKYDRAINKTVIGLFIVIISTSSYWVL